VVKPVLQISVLGLYEVRLGDASALAFESLKTQALLAYLAVESTRPHSREALAGMLWPDRPASAALANLRHTLASLRTTLGERLQEQDVSLHSFFITSSNRLRFKLSGAVWVDLYEFDQRLALAELERDKGLQTTIAHLSDAVQLYRGRFMEGFSLRGCPEFEDWMLLRRENTALQQQKALRSLAEALEASGACDLALSTMRRLLQLEPWDESAHRKMMALLASQGQRSAAMSQYDRCCKLLRDELGVEPEEDTLQLYEQIRDGMYVDCDLKEGGGLFNRDAESYRQITLAGKLPRNRFAGRASELERLHRTLKLALKGQGQLVFITGEAGSGKTSLAWEFARQAMAQQGDVLFAAGRCNMNTGFEDPYLPFREILHMLVGGHATQPGSILTPEHLRRLTEAFPDTIQSLLAMGTELIGSFVSRETLLQRIETFSPGRYTWQHEYQQALNQFPPGAEASLMREPAGSSALTRLPAESLTRTLSELARQRPLILLIDNLQWADTRSISLLHFLCKRLSGSRMMILGAYRPQDIALGQRQPDLAWERHPLEPVRLELQRAFGEIELDLDQSDGRAFIEALVDSEPNCLDETFRQTLYCQTEGNPLFTIELLRSMQERGDLVQDTCGRWEQGRRLDWDQLPARVEAVIAERIGRIPHPQQEMLRVASVEGETFTGEVVATLLGLDERQTLSCLSGLLSREQKIVQAVNVVHTRFVPAGPPTRLSHYRFTHILFQKYLYHSLDPVERSVLHEKTGMTLEKLYGPAVNEIALQLAWHFEQAGRTTRAAEFLLVAAKQAMNLSAPLQAKALYDRCLGLLRQIPQSPESIRLEVQVQLAHDALFGV
jgi:DNA-binding SARP family transcriptional activator